MIYSTSGIRSGRVATTIYLWMISQATCPRSSAAVEAAGHHHIVQVIYWIARAVTERPQTRASTKRTGSVTSPCSKVCALARSRRRPPLCRVMSLAQRIGRQKRYSLDDSRSAENKQHPSKESSSPNISQKAVLTQPYKPALDDHIPRREWTSRTTRAK